MNKYNYTDFDPILTDQITATLAIEDLELPTPIAYVKQEIRIGTINYPLLKMAPPGIVQMDKKFIGLGSKKFPDGVRRFAVLNFETKPPKILWMEVPMDNTGNEDLNTNGPELV